MADVKYIVYRAMTLQRPLGTNAIAWMSNSRASAESHFNVLKGGFDEWNRPDPRYGLLLYMLPRDGEDVLLSYKDIPNIKLSDLDNIKTESKGARK